MSQLNLVKHDCTSHTDMVHAVEFGTNQEIYTFGDDGIINQFTYTGNLLGEITKLSETFVTDCHRAPQRRIPTSITNKTQASIDDTLAIACTDGTFRLLTPKRFSKKTCHSGAVLCVRWSWDGSQLATSGEDGHLMILTKSGESLKVAKTESPIFALSWGASDDQIAYCFGNRIAIRLLNVSRKQNVWHAHSGIILTLDWCPSNGIIATGGEDRTYRLWTKEGLNLYTSRVFPYPITSIAWAPDGETFVVGSFNTIVLCDKFGWEKHLFHEDTGSIECLRWSSNGMRVAAGGCNSTLLIVDIPPKPVRWENYVVSQETHGHLNVRDVALDTTETIDLNLHHRDPNSIPSIQHMCVNAGHLVVVTQNQILSFEMPNVNANPPTSIGLPAPLIVLCVLAPNHFVIVSSSQAGLLCTVFSYDGKTISEINIGSYVSNTSSITKATVTTNHTFLAFIEGSDGKVVRIFSVQSGKQHGQPLRVDGGAAEISLSQKGKQSMLAIVDKSHSLELYAVRVGERMKVSSVVDSIKWHTTTDQLAVIMENALSVIVYPFGVFVDATSITKFRHVYPLQLSSNPLQLGGIGSAMGSGAAQTTANMHVSENVSIEHFYGNMVFYCRASDGVTQCVGTKPYGKMLHEAAENGRWEEATRLCRYTNDKTLWHSYGAMSLEAKELNSAALAYSSLEDVEKVKYISHIKDTPTPEGKSAALLVFRRKPDEAEKVYLSAGLKREAVKLNVRLFRWQRALEIAKEAEGESGGESQVNLLEYCVGLRKRYLGMTHKKEEDLEEYQTYTDLEVDLMSIKNQIKEEKAQKKKAIRKARAAQKEKRKVEED
ncbi:putative intraflagellar transport protein 80 like protein [Blattamonas nauphoetae]|uniref:Intraflagellar transport protein 80 like protein n=1 Tax=Blattamonas nauphoetae TaxID=2049346 RepID=A0ABQ9YLG2_9EUKA|nr:putative intraflagellar transport protein 80 like protein [Blattamonas nauphoetae]